MTGGRDYQQSYYSLLIDISKSTAKKIGFSRDLKNYQNTHRNKVVLECSVHLQLQVAVGIWLVS